MNHYPRTVAAIAAASLLAAFAAQANKGAEYKPHHHHKEHHKNFFITGGATYLEPSVNGLDYLDVIDSSAPVVAVTTEAIEPEFNWGYYIAAGYRISHHYDVQADWAQYNSSISDSSSIVGNGTTSATSSNELTYPAPADATNTANSKQNIDYSVFNATLGQYHDITEMLRTRLFAGIQYAKVDATTENLYSSTAIPTVAVDRYTSSFSAAGPEVGLDLEYKIWHTFGMVGHFGAAFLVGQQEVSSNVTTLDRQTFIQNSVNTEDVARLIPAMDAKLGVNWNVPYSYDKFSFGIEAGYQIAYYWDVIDQVQFNDNVAEHNYSNYGNMGPYLNLTAMF